MSVLVVPAVYPSLEGDAPARMMPPGARPTPYEEGSAMKDSTVRSDVFGVSRAWLAFLSVERGLLDSTVTAYRREMRQLWRRVGDRVLEASTEDLREYLIAMGGKASTIANRIAAMRSFYGFLVRTDRRLDDPTVKLDRPRQHRGLPHPILDRERVFERLTPEMRLVMVVLLETGLRISEACALRVPIPAPEQIVVRGKGAKERIVLLTDKARAALDALGGAIPRKVRTVQRAFQKAGTHPHACRHTLACDLASAGAELGEVQEIMGHSSPATTRVYMAYQTDRLWGAQAKRERMLEAVDV